MKEPYKIVIYTIVCLPVRGDNPRASTFMSMILDIFGKRGAYCDGDCPMCQKVNNSDAAVVELAGKK